MVIETFLIGLVLAVLYVEIMDIYPGGIIVPGYIALYLDQPLRVAATVLIAFISLYSYRMLSRRFLLFGKRRFVLILLLGVFWGQVWFILVPRFFADPVELRVIGWIIPGLLANTLGKQKWLPTLTSLVTVAVAAYFVAGLLRWL